MQPWKKDQVVIFKEFFSFGNIKLSMCVYNARLRQSYRFEGQFISLGTKLGYKLGYRLIANGYNSTQYHFIECEF